MPHLKIKNMNDFNIIKEVDSLLSNSVRVYWNGLMPNDDTRKVLVTLVNDPLEYIAKFKLNANKYFKVKNIEHGINEFKKLYEYLYSEKFDDSKINVSNINTNKDIYLLLFLR